MTAVQCILGSDTQESKEPVVINFVDFMLFDLDQDRQDGTNGKTREQASA